MRWLLFILLYSLSVAIFADPAVVNVYNWANYLPNDIIQQFEQETGIHVNYSTYEGNDALYAKLKADPHTGYDVIVPSSYFIARLHREGMLRILDKKQLPNIKYLNPALLNKPFDLGNQYSLPYFWGSTGIVVNKRYVDPTKLTRWTDLWQPQYKNQLLLLNDAHDIFSMGLMVKGYSANDDNPQHIEIAFQALKKLLPNVKLFNSDAAAEDYIDENALLGMAYNGDIYRAMQENPDLVYIYPQEGFTVWIDCFAIPKYAPHLTNAYRFINFLLRPTIAAKLSQELGYASPNQGALAYLPAKMRNNLTIYPSAQILARAQFEMDQGSLDQIFEKYTELLKLTA